MASDGPCRAGAKPAVRQTVRFRTPDDLQHRAELGFCSWQVLGSNQRRLSRRFYRRTSFAAEQVAGLRLYGHKRTRTVTAFRTGSVPESSACAPDPERK
jgi:hypothetical protein